MRTRTPLVLPAHDEATSVETGEVLFVGTATVILRYAGFTILTDPNFLHQGEHAPLGYGLRSKRLTEPALSLEELPPIDFVVLSHHHGDHFDPQVERDLDRNLPIVSTEHAVKKLRRQGFTRLHPLETWETQTITRGKSSVRVTALPGRHGPGVLNAALPPVMGSMLEFAETGEELLRLYITGDTLVHDRLHEIPRRYPDIHLALVHLGGTRVLGVLLTMDGRQGVDLLNIVKPRHAIPIHYDDYTVFKSPLSDFVEEVARRGVPSELHYVGRGETFRFTLSDLTA
jgi:L-ascorbate metabolism protein UlaG (beta-lactamase superfamily)